MPKKESGAQGRKRRAQFEVFLNEFRKFMRKYFKSSGYVKRQSADIRRQDDSAGTDNHKIVKHRGRKIFVCPEAQDTLATPLLKSCSCFKVFSLNISHCIFYCELRIFRADSSIVK